MGRKKKSDSKEKTRRKDYFPQKQNCSYLGESQRKKRAWGPSIIKIRLLKPTRTPAKEREAWQLRRETNIGRAVVIQNEKRTRSPAGTNLVIIYLPERFYK